MLANRHRYRVLMAGNQTVIMGIKGRCFSATRGIVIAAFTLLFNQSSSCFPSHFFLDTHFFTTLRDCGSFRRDTKIKVTHRINVN